VQLVEDGPIAPGSSESEIPEVEVEVLAADPVMNPEHHSGQIGVTALGGVHMRLRTDSIVAHELLGRMGHEAARFAQEGIGGQRIRMTVFADRIMALVAALISVREWLAINLKRASPPRAAAVSTRGRRGPRPGFAPVGPPPALCRGGAPA
jgi:hypothetical protein